mmetsp:Transcript_10296/g.36071  ORF Transcript_10296/g.36071 Transcript_10296/m.36071 type:complete len:231 (-) Transcript_10296:2162-2854(-)
MEVQDEDHLGLARRRGGCSLRPTPLWQEARHQPLRGLVGGRQGVGHEEIEVLQEGLQGLRVVLEARPLPKHRQQLRVQLPPLVQCTGAVRIPAKHAWTGDNVRHSIQQPLGIQHDCGRTGKVEQLAQPMKERQARLDLIGGQAQGGRQTRAFLERDALPASSVGIGAGEHIEKMRPARRDAAHFVDGLLRQLVQGVAQVIHAVLPFRGGSAVVDGEEQKLVLLVDAEPLM